MKIWIIFFTTCLIGLSHCGKAGKELKVQVKAAEKDQLSANLARKITVTYHDPQDHEKLHVDSPILGFGQPVSLKSGVPQDFVWEKDGKWQAAAYTSDGLLLLRGSAQADPKNTDLIEIEISRQETPAAVFASPILRKMRLIRTPFLSDFSLKMEDLRKDIDKKRCTAIPQITIDLTTGFYPAMVFETIMKEPDLFFEVGSYDEKDTFKSISNPIRPVPIEPSGDAVLEISPKNFVDTDNTVPLRLALGIYSGQERHYEGCIFIITNAPIQPVKLDSSRKAKKRL